MKSVLITGASGGIGAEIARAAAERGWTVILGYRSGLARATALAEEIGRRGGRALLMANDLEAPEELPAGLRELSGKIQRLDALVLCASLPPEFNSFTKLTRELFLRHVTVNAVASHVLIVETWKLFFRSREAGHVVGVLSRAMGPPQAPYMTGYVASKHALASVLESAAAELGRDGLRVSAVSPHFTETPMLTRLHPHLAEALLAKAPGGRFLPPRKVAERVVAQLEDPPEPGRFVVEPVGAEEVQR